MYTFLSSSLGADNFQLFLHIIGSILSGRWFLLYRVYHTACYVGCGAIPLHGYLTLGTHAQQGLLFLLKGRVPMALARLL